MEQKEKDEEEIKAKKYAAKEYKFSKFGSGQFVDVKKAKHLVDDPNKYVYSLEDVAKHNKRYDCWTVWKGKIYDITTYIEKHPGGDKILAGAGKDCTKLYNKFHAYVNADYLIGNL